MPRAPTGLNNLEDRRLLFNFEFSQHGINEDI